MSMDKQQDTFTTNNNLVFLLSGGKKEWLNMEFLNAKTVNEYSQSN
jgi:hypothetical protein